MCISIYNLHVHVYACFSFCILYGKLFKFIFIYFIFPENGKLKEHLIDELDYQLMPDEGWAKVVSWYGLTEGQVNYETKVDFLKI